MFSILISKLTKLSKWYVYLNLTCILDITIHYIFLVSLIWTLKCLFSVHSSSRWLLLILMWSICSLGKQTLMGLKTSMEIVVIYLNIFRINTWDKNSISFRQWSLYGLLPLRPLTVKVITINQSTNLGKTVWISALKKVLLLSQIVFIDLIQKLLQNHVIHLKCECEWIISKS